ncbi:phage baseplate assembly protein [Paraburkholderia tropica]|uniref:phage baseplate assembly protein n=1 Tax=Paraburkholderia tropica TaxID=92647 RepID=UPI002AB667CF|nr:Mu P family protein [Paraburkholderia tropica]
MDDELYLSVGDQTITGWTDIRVTRGIERCVSDFDIGLTEEQVEQDEVTEVVVQPGDECLIDLGADLVLTGYVDTYVPGFSPSAHSVRVSGRSKCEDLVDCSAVWPNGQISGTSALDVATKLAAHYGISVSCDVSDLVAIPQFNVFIGETPFEIIERVSRYSQLLVYDQPDGSLRLARAQSGDTGARATGGIVQGANVQAASVLYAAAERFSKYTCFAQSVLSFTDAGIGPNMIATVSDPNVKRVRERYIVAEAVQGFLDLAKRRAIWEMNRRAGRAAVVSVTVDSWRDSGGVLWTPNTLVFVDIPKLKISKKTWLIGEVTYKRSAEEGTTAELMIMDPTAYYPEPIALQPLFVDSSTIGGQN